MDGLTEFPIDQLRPFFGETHQQNRDVAAELADGLKLARRSDTRHYLHMLHVGNAAQHLGSLPERGESFHCVMKGNYHAWDLVPAVLKLAAPATIRRLDVATLGFNNANVADLCELLDAGQVGAVTFLCSCYFRDSSRGEFDFLRAQLAARQGRVAAVRSHAKILLMELSDARSIVVESSANLRSCRNVEQFTMFNDPELLAFHRGWMEELHAQADRTDAARTKAETEPTQATRREPRKAKDRRR